MTTKHSKRSAIDDCYKSNVITHDVHIALQRLVRRMTERAKVFSDCSVHANVYPVCAFAMGRIQVAD